MASRLPAFLRRRRVLVGLQVAFLVGALAFLAYAVRDTWAEALPLLEDVDPLFLFASLVVLAAYYLLFVVGWQWILAAFGIRVAYRIALQAEMASMLAKYIPGGVWTPLARIVWLRRAGGVHDTSFVFSSILLEAGLSAVAGILVFVVGLTAVEEIDTPLWPLLAFGALLAVLLHPRVFTALARALFRRFDAPEPPRLPYRSLVSLLVYYSFTWLVGGAGALPAPALARRRPGHLDHPLPGRRRRGRGDRGGARRVRAFRPRRARSLDVRPAGDHRSLRRRARGHGAQPARHHDRGGAAPRRRAPRGPAEPALTSSGGR